MTAQAIDSIMNDNGMGPTTATIYLKGGCTIEVTNSFEPQYEEEANLVTFAGERSNRTIYTTIEMDQIIAIQYTA